MRVNPAEAFTDRYPFAGPTMWMLAVTFFAAQIGVAYNWRTQPAPGFPVGAAHPYSFFADTISDLGQTSRYGYGRPPMWSPDHVWMNVAFVLLGGFMIVGSLLIYQEFTETGRWRRAVAAAGFAAQALAGAGAVVVGLVPENESTFGHEIGAAGAIGVGTLGVLLLGLTLPLPGRIRRFMLWTSPVSLTAVLLYGLHEYLGFGRGGMERVAAYPEVIWLIIFGFYIAQSHWAYGSVHRAPAGRPGRLRLQPRGTLPAGRPGAPYTTSILSLGGTPGASPAFRLARPAADWIHLSPSGRLSGTPPRTGLTRVSVEVTDGRCSAVKTFTVPILRRRKGPA